MTYKMSATMAEKLINDSQKISSMPKQTPSTQQMSAAALANARNTIMELESLKSNRNSECADTVSNNPAKKQPAGGVKCLPFLPNNCISSSNSTNTNNSTNENSNETNSFSGVQQRYELTNNSKSKRPISSQLHDTTSSPNGNTNLIQNNANSSIAQSPKRIIGFLPITFTNEAQNKSYSSSNENLDACQSEEELDQKRGNNNFIFSNPSSREKTPEGYRDETFQKQIKIPVQSDFEMSFSKSPNDNTESSFAKLSNVKKDKNVDSNADSGHSTTTPQPAPRKSKSYVKIFLQGVGVKASSPPPTNLTSTKEATPSTTTTNVLPSSISSPGSSRKILGFNIETNNNDSKLESADKNDSVMTPLQHLNKTRPKRSNVKRPTFKPNQQSNPDSDVHDLDFQDNDNTFKLNPISDMIIEEPNGELNKKSPNITQPSKSTVEQPKIRYFDKHFF